MPEFARLKVEPKDHKIIKDLAKKADKTIMKFVKDLIAAYRGQK